MRLHPIVVALFVTFLGRQAAALGVGQPQGDLWLGSPLALRVPVVLDNAQAVGSLCTQVELRQGDATQSPTAVQAVLEPGPTPERPYLAIRSTRAIEEPVLHLRVQLGCQGSTTREFTLLADPPTVRPAIIAPPAGANPSVATRRPAAAGSSSSPSSPAARAPAPAAESATAAARSRPGEGSRRSAAVAGPQAGSASPERAKPAARPASAPRGAGTSAPQSRLQLDSLEPLPKEMPLRVARRLETPLGTAVVTGPVPGLPQGEAAAGSSQPAPAAPTPEQVERTRQLEAALAELRVQASQNRQTVAQLQGELSEARESRYSNWLIQLLSLLLLLALIALWIVRKRSDGGAPDEGGSPFAPVPQPSMRERLSRRRASRRAEPDDEELPDPPRFFGAAAVGQAAADDEDDDRDAPAQAATGFSDTVPGSTLFHAQAAATGERAHDVDELHDVQQQAEFFSSLGEHERAVEALRHYVDAHPQASAMAYLELLHLYHQLQRKDDYEALRQRCQQALNVRLPDFRGFGAVGGRRLQDYPWALERLQSLWPSSQTLDLIEELLFRSGAEDGEPFDLAAYRELLMLHALVQEQHFSDGQPWPALEELLRLPGHEAEPGAAESPPAGTLRASLREEPTGLDPSLFVPEHFAQMLAQEHDRSSGAELPPLELDMDLSRLEAQLIETIPLSLRRPPEAAPEPESEVPTMPLPLNEPLRLVPRADETPPPAPSRPRPDKSGGGSGGSPQAPRRQP
ncbi:hypothetical protein PGB34_01970 [Xenophilus arseniciresistens]|uniref:Tetratricopeptide repeat protein n=1 Tax=Xenophilus arseniciresistens TaxID=1283306 RepID=A0AAE3N688_9BURK|nr:hypothetical protein [Xenophilus arseniciresistens]MDA7415121.1 hypothetical protein [Xenophilus arseniciresistens]